MSGPEGHPARAPDFEPPSIALGGLSALVFRIIELAALILMVVVTGRLMEPAGRGLYALASVTMMFLLLPLGPVWLGNVVEMTRGRSSLPELLGGSIVIAAVGGLATGVAAIAIAPLFGDRWWVVALPATVTPFILLLKYEEGLYTGLGHVRAVNYIKVAIAVTPLAFISPPLLAGAATQTAIAIWTLSFVVLALAVFFPLCSFVGHPRRPRDRGHYRRVITYGGTISALNAVDAVNDRVGLLALAAFAGAAAVGIFSIALAAARVLLVAPQALALSAFRRIGISSPEPSSELTLRTIRHNMLFTIGGAALAFPIVLVGVPWSVGEEYGDVPVLFLLLVPNVVCVAALTALYTFFEVQARKPGTLLLVGGVALAANLGLTVALVPAWGMRGAAVAASLASLVGGTVAFEAFRRETGAHWRDIVPGRVELADYAALAATFRARRRRGDDATAGR